MVNRIALNQLQKQADRINAQNKKLMDNLKELFPELADRIFMNVLSEIEIPEDMTYIVVETDDYTRIDQKSKSATENVGITLWSTNREDPTFDHLKILLAGGESGLKFTNSSNDYVVMSDNSTIVNMFVATFQRGVLVGC